jgi:hypothetical protein
MSVNNLILTSDLVTFQNVKHAYLYGVNWVDALLDIVLHALVLNLYYKIILNPLISYCFVYV